MKSHIRNVVEILAEAEQRAEDKQDAATMLATATLFAMAECGATKDDVFEVVNGLWDTVVTARDVSQSQMTVKQ